ncbi:hypothetical protein Pelo_8333 [Pelomyxa schiedti]|nr:hypothetical protein Pelo_8333 [Pelomyxa schiedti]
MDSMSVRNGLSKVKVLLEEGFITPEEYARRLEENAHRAPSPYVSSYTTTTSSMESNSNVNPEKRKLDDLLESGFISQDEYASRLAELGPLVQEQPNRSSGSPPTVTPTVSAGGRCEKCGAHANLCLCAGTSKKAKEEASTPESTWQADRCDICGAHKSLCLCSGTAKKREMESAAAVKEDKTDWMVERCTTCGAHRSLCMCEGTTKRIQEEHEQQFTELVCDRCGSAASVCTCPNFDSCSKCGNSMEKKVCQWQQPRCAACHAFPSLCLCNN